ncbi:MAG: DEAD/DEAH box helicase [Deltaproteobacteria bacterium]|nr:DEAD/DEAH box helicase [Deltaproteobacteria bacterium]
MCSSSENPPTDPPPSPPGFEGFGIDPRLLEAVTALGFETPTAVQLQAIPPLLEGRDVIGRARTGSGKTAAFGLPLLERVKEGGAVRALVVAPTRELALQVGAALQSFAKRIRGLRLITVYGGAPYPPQLKALRAGASVVVGTPGRMIDLLDRGALDLSAVDFVVIDEADEMLRMGFIDDVEKLLQATPDSRQVALFSATMPDPIRKVARKHLHMAFELKVESQALTVEHIEQHWIRVPESNKLDALIRVLRGVTHGTTLVFARTRVDCAEVADSLAKRGVTVEALHGDMSQPARERVVHALRASRIEVVIATDVAARGIDVQHITHVINFDFPPDAESYVHRIGRTARAGRQGTAISFVTPRAVGRLDRLRRILKVPIDVMAVPSDADIARLERGRIKTSMHQVAEGALLDGANALLAEAVEEGSFGLEEIAAAAVHLLAQKEHVSLRDMPPEGLPAWAVERPTRKREKRARGAEDDRPRGERPRAERPARPDGPDETRETQLFFPLGYSRGVRPGDIVGLLANAAQVPASSIGRITILPHESFVGVSEKVAAEVLKILPEVQLRGVVVPISIARPRSQEPPHDGSRPPARRKPTPKAKRPRKPWRALKRTTAGKSARGPKPKAGGKQRPNPKPRPS